MTCATLLLFHLYGTKPLNPPFPLPEHAEVTAVFLHERQNSKRNVWQLPAFLDAYEITKIERIQNDELWLLRPFGL